MTTRNKAGDEWPHVKPSTYANGTPCWLVDTRIQGKGSRLYFKDEGEARDVARRARLQRRDYGREHFQMDNADRTDAERALSILDPFGKTLVEAANFYAAHLEAMEGSRGVLEAFGQYQDNLATRELSAAHLKDVRLRVGRFCEAFAERRMSEVLVEEIDAWLASLGVSGATLNGYRRHVVAFFGFAEKRGWCIGNPAQKTHASKVTPGAVGILTVPEMVRLLGAASPEILPGLAIGAFAGLRVAEVERLEWKHVDLAERLVEVTATNAKSSKRRLVAISDNLFEWLSPLARKAGRVWPESAGHARGLVDSARLAAGFGGEDVDARSGLKPWPINALRHSFASYHLAEFRDAAKLALEMGHSTTELIFAHYRQLVKPAEGAKYWRILPGA